MREVLLDPARERPVVAVTTIPRSGHTWIDPEELDAELAGLADVARIETGDATWELAEALPPRLDVYGGALRVWWPGLDERADPFEHRLYFVRSPEEASRVRQRIVAAVQERALRSSAGGEAVVPVSVKSVQGATIEVAGEKLSGPLRYADLPLEELARQLQVGTSLHARPVRLLFDGRWEFSVQGLLPSPWERFLEEVSPGDVFVGRVQNVREFGAFIDLLPQVAGLVHISELDWNFIESVEDFVRPGELVPVEVVALDAGSRRIELSIKRAHGRQARPLPSLAPGWPPFRWEGELAAGPNGAAAPPAESVERLRALEEELEGAAEERGRLAALNRQLRDQVQSLKKQLQSAEDSRLALERSVAAVTDPLSSERAFLQGVRVAYARLFGEGDRLERLLRPMRVGSSFLESVRALDGVEIDKVLEVCAQVAADSAHEVPGREVHQLRDGPRGAGSRVRASDRAQAWRCALQVGTPSARRLHWWRIPGPDGGTIEFACVGVHDSYAIPE